MLVSLWGQVKVDGLAGVDRLLKADMVISRRRRKSPVIRDPLPTPKLGLSKVDKLDWIAQARPLSKEK